MKTKYLFFILLLSICWRSYGQLKLGSAVVTRSASNVTEQVVKIFDIKDHTDPIASPVPTLGDNWNLYDYPFTNWVSPTLGQVFGIAVNTRNKNIFVSTTQIYPPIATYGYTNGFTNYKDPSPSNQRQAGSPLIWSLDPTVVNGGLSALVVSTQDPRLPATPSNAIFNRGTDIGNICYDKIHDQVFATNMEDGRIYRIKVSTHEVLSRYDPFTRFTITGPPYSTVPSFAALGERLWGIAFKNNKLYFSKWNEDYGNQSTAQNEIYEVDIDPTSGDFVAPYYATNEYEDPSILPIIQIQYFAHDHDDYSNPISDIEISEDGNSMLLAERTMYGPYIDISSLYTQIDMYWAHKSRVLRYDLSGSTWTGPINQYNLGNYSVSANSSGGVDFGYAVIDPANPTSDTCEKRVWATGDALKHSSPHDSYHTNEFVYGFAGLPIAGNTAFHNLSSDVSAVNNSSIVQDVFNRTAHTSYTGTGGYTYTPKEMIGDIDVYRGPCACSVSPSILNDPAACLGTNTPFTFSGGPWGRYSIDGGPLVLVSLPYTYNSSTLALGSHTVSLTVYSVDPLHFDSWCEKTTTATINVIGVTAGLTLASNNICAGGVLDMTTTGGTYGKVYFKDAMGTIINYLGPIAVGTGHFTLPVGSAPAGSYTACFTAYTSDPAGMGLICSDEVCVPFTIISVTASLSLGSTSICKNGTLDMTGTGGNYGQFIIYDAMSMQVYTSLVTATTGGMLTESWPNTLPPGSYTVCYYAYAARPSVAFTPCSGKACQIFKVLDINPAVIKLSNSMVCQSGTLSVTGINGAYGEFFVKDATGTPIMVSPVLTVSGMGTVDYTFTPMPAALGAYSVCYVEYTSYPTAAMGGACTDTACAPFTIWDCCALVHPQFSINDSTIFDTICLGSLARLHFSGAPWGVLYSDTERVDNKPIMRIPATGWTFPAPIDNTTPLGTHYVCFIGYGDSSHTACPDTVCVKVVVIDCGCGPFLGSSHMESYSKDLEYTYWDSQSSPAASFINWLVDDTLVEQTTYMDSFKHTFTPGHHRICMQTAHVLPAGPHGDNICCYDEVCDTVNINACVVWKATDTIVTELDSTNYHNVIFTFHGSHTIVPTIIWTFGDNTHLATHDTIVHHEFFDGDGTKSVCATIIWSFGDSIKYDSLGVCCCVDTICMKVDVEPCAIPEFDIVITDNPSLGHYVFQIQHTTSFTYFGAGSWSMTPGGSITSADDISVATVNLDGSYEVCVEFDYIVRLGGDEGFPCHARICKTFNLKGGKKGGKFRAFPNPNNGNMIVEITNYGDAKSAKVEIANMAGQVVMTKTISNLVKGSSQNYMNISSLPQGIYTLKMTMDDGVQQVDKLIRE